MHKGCKNSNIPKNNRNFWIDKLTRTVERDEKNYRELENLKIKTVVVWECTLKAMKKNETFEKRILDNIVSVIESEASYLFYEI